MDLHSPVQEMQSRRTHTQPDEGYSEDFMHGQVDDDRSKDSGNLSDAVKLILRSIENLPIEERLHCLQISSGLLPSHDQLSFLKNILCTAPTWMKQDVSSHLDSLMYFDPVQYFPYEIIQTIFSHLDPKELLNASVVSRGWREHAQDEELWRYAFRREGWRLDDTSVRYVESTRRAGMVGSHAVHRRDSRKRRREEAFLDADRVPTLEQEDAEPELMEGVECTPPAKLALSPVSSPVFQLPRSRPSKLRDHRRSSVDSARTTDTMNVSHGTFKLQPTVWQTDFGGTPEAKISWAYLYKHRRLLERNWDNGRYVTFRLPHPKYESEGHAECVYTIQHVGSILVSGSRDRTIRVWDLDTCRLRGQPLRGHEASVLCLQFDPSPQNDLIVSGGSDSWVIIWRFSTGEILKKLTTAHSESVLNLRFDDRYIVTCSKDKTIKIWNRRAITSDSPELPAHVLPHFAQDSSELFIKEFSLISVLTGHQAAVNAVMIHDNVIVSASGDRVIKAWSINTGRCERTYTGHTKGIACVQYDGRRIVSGSSDNTVRIFDADQQAEVACLQGHIDLVRTVQARFGDLETVSDHELHEQARKADMRWSKAMAMGAQEASGSRHGRRNAGSSRPEDMLTVGARVPPGGGGTKWARIVSGSYDESVIIWKKDREGKWMPRIKLQQDPWLQRGNRRPPPPRPPPAPHNTDQPPARTPNDDQRTLTTVTRQNTSSTQATHGSNNDQGNTTPQRPGDTGPDPVRRALMQASAAAAAHQRAHAAATEGQDPAGARPPRVETDRAPTAAPVPRAVSSVHHFSQRDSNRVFKLQFDARRIVCCSQNRVIMGWDFANGNEDLARVGSWCEETY